MRWFLLLIVSLSLSAASHASDDDGHEHVAVEVPADAEISVGPNETVINVNGMVCTFCAYGLSKALGKLEELDTERHRDGVLVDIESHLVTLALLPGTAIPFAEIEQRIRAAGYETVKFTFLIEGQVSREGEQLVLIGKAPAQRFSLQPLGVPVAEGVDVVVQAELTASVLEGLDPAAAMPVRVDALR